MSHNIQYFTYQENVNKKKVFAELSDYVAHEDWQEGCSGLYNPIRWLDFVCKDYNSAVEYIQSHDRGDYDNLAVKYRVYDKIEPSKAYLTLMERRKAEIEKRDNYINAHSVKTFKSNFIGCPNCSSKLNREFLRSEKCPLCGAELRGNTTIETIKRYNTNIKELEKKMADENAKLKEKAIKSSTIEWIVKIEYHT